MVNRWGKEIGGMKQPQVIMPIKKIQRAKLKGIWVFLFFMVSSLFLGMVLPEKGLSQGGKKVEKKSHFLRQMEIQGSIMNPKIFFQIPWRTPESIEDSGFLGMRNIFQDLFVPINPEVFERVFQMDKHIMKGRGETILQKSDQHLKGE